MVYLLYLQVPFNYYLHILEKIIIFMARCLKLMLEFK